MKYIVVKGPCPLELESAIVFPDYISHKAVARVHRASDADFRVVSAGFVQKRDGKFYVYGESESLGGMKSRQNTDADIINRDFERMS